jgi:hypothetical protein
MNADSMHEPENVDMEVNQARRHDATRGIDFFNAFIPRDGWRDLANPTVRDSYVPPAERFPDWIEDPSTGNEKIVCHDLKLPRMKKSANLPPGHRRSNDSC